MKVQIELDDKYVRDLISSAGSTYWAKDFKWQKGKFAFHLVEWVCDEPIRHSVSDSDVSRAIRTMVIEASHHLADIIRQNDDMWTGDALIQCAIFGKLKYG